MFGTESSRPTKTHYVIFFIHLCTRGVPYGTVYLERIVRLSTVRIDRMISVAN